MVIWPDAFGRQASGRSERASPVLRLSLTSFAAATTGMTSGLVSLPSNVPETFTAPV